MEELGYLNVILVVRERQQLGLGYHQALGKRNRFRLLFEPQVLYKETRLSEILLETGKRLASSISSCTQIMLYGVR
jgi:hypothetical protein